MLVRVLLNNQQLSRTECQKKQPLDTEMNISAILNAYSGNVV